MLRILHLEDDPTDSELVRELLDQDGLNVQIDRVDAMADLRQALERGGYALILSDYAIPGVDPLEAMRAARQLRPEVPLIVVSGTLGEDLAIETLKLGATDYVLKHRLGRLVPAVRRALQEAEEQARRRQAETALRRSEQRYRTLFESIDEGFCIIEMIFDEGGKPIDYRFLETNPSFEKQSGLIHVQGKTMRELAPEHEEYWFETYGRIALTGQPVRFENRAEQLGRWFDVYAFRFGQAEDRQVAVLFSDVTERKRMVEEFQRAKEAAEAANKTKDYFLAVLSHELRTPLTPVLAAVTFIEKRANLPAELREEVITIRRNVELEARLIDDLLDLTRISRGKVELHHEILDAHDAVRSAVDTFREEIQTKGLKVSLSLLAPDRRIWADPGRIQQVLWNLVGNAVKFTPPEGSIRIRSSNEGGRLRIEVTDTGMGIAPEKLAMIFNAFEQGERTLTRGMGGLGLGLSIARSLVEMHQGSLTAASAGPNQGASFTLDLPTTAADPKKTVPAPAPTSQAIKKELRILLVEDHEDTARMLARLLRSFGHAVQTAGGVHAALGLAAKESFDLLISDIGLPDGSGLELMRQIKQRHGIKGIAVSGFGTDEDVRNSREAGFERHLTKPLNFQMLEAVIMQMA